MSGEHLDARAAAMIAHPAYSTSRYFGLVHRIGPEVLPVSVAPRRSRIRLDAAPCGTLIGVAASRCELPIRPMARLGHALSIEHYQSGKEVICVELIGF
jgi:hypothetical protein